MSDVYYYSAQEVRNRLQQGYVLTKDTCKPFAQDAKKGDWFKLKGNPGSMGVKHAKDVQTFFRIDFDSQYPDLNRATDYILNDANGFFVQRHGDYIFLQHPLDTMRKKNQAKNDPSVVPGPERKFFDEDTSTTCTDLPIPSVCVAKKKAVDNKPTEKSNTPSTPVAAPKRVGLQIKRTTPTVAPSVTAAPHVPTTPVPTPAHGTKRKIQEPVVIEDSDEESEDTREESDEDDVQENSEESEECEREPMEEETVPEKGTEQMLKEELEELYPEHEFGTIEKKHNWYKANIENGHYITVSLDKGIGCLLNGVQIYYSLENRLSPQLIARIRESLTANKKQKTHSTEKQKEDHARVVLMDATIEKINEEGLRLKYRHLGPIEDLDPVYGIWQSKVNSNHDDYLYKRLTCLKGDKAIAITPPTQAQLGIGNPGAHCSQLRL